jgi:hypothetical protein
MLVADAGDHRILGWSPPPDADRDADLVLGQADFTTADEWPYGPHTNDRFRFPYAVCLDAGGQERSDSGIDTGGQERSDSGIDTAGRLAVADTANNRVLLWDGVPDPREGRSRRRPRAGSTRLRLQRREPLDLGAARRCAGRMGCPCAATPWQSPTPETTG